MLGDFLLVTAFTNNRLFAGRRMDRLLDGTTINGGQTIEYDIPDGAGGALFIRAGAIIPQWLEIDYIGQTNAERIELHIYPYAQQPIRPL